MDTYHQRYLAEEVAEDCALGLMTRREALRRLGMMGFTAFGASALLAACASDDKNGATGSSTTAPSASGPTPTPTTTPATAAGGATPADTTETITYPSGRTTPLTGAWAPATDPKGAVVVIHENRGLTRHIRTVASLLAADGYSAIAVDLLSEEGGSAKVGEADAGAALNAAGGSRHVNDVRSTLDELATRQPGAKLGMIGFCFGGTTAWAVLGSGESRVAAATPFYGTVEPTVDFSGAKAAVLGVYAELDTRVNATRDTARAALEKAGLTHELRTFPGVNHAFFNDTGERYDATQASAAYQAVLDWFARHLA
ncbi:MAG: carboxymethylenebutenolidase [Actinomycetota bacterium]|jgi:carboxymethylenebutenolidase|nr:carboxymethylenebutenolidase [Actinomycetota bacterium]